MSDLAAPVADAVQDKADKDCKGLNHLEEAGHLQQPRHSLATKPSQSVSNKRGRLWVLMGSVR